MNEKYISIEILNDFYFSVKILSQVESTAIVPFEKKVAIYNSINKQKLSILFYKPVWDLYKNNIFPTLTHAVVEIHHIKVSQHSNKNF